jgi:transcription antitermination factor NusG
MQKNWYAVYTKPNCEKRFASLLTKRKIENFCPLNSRKISALRRSKILEEPVFRCYVFVKVTPAEIESLKQTYGVINILYWMCEPAVIKQNEIDAIKEFTTDHKNLELERTQVNLHDVAQVIDGPSYSIEGNVFAVKNRTLKVSLPSLGYIMIAKMEDESIFGWEKNILQNNSFVHS